MNRLSRNILYRFLLLVVVVLAVLSWVVFAHADPVDTSIDPVVTEEPAPGPTVEAEKIMEAEVKAVDRKAVIDRLRLLQGKLQEVDALLSDLQAQRQQIDATINQNVTLRLKLQGAIETLADLVQ